jgi:uncharacterized membrane protein
MAHPRSVSVYVGLAECVSIGVAFCLLARLDIGMAPRKMSRPLRLSMGVLFGICLLVFGVAHLRYPVPTAGLIPNWLPWRLGLAYLTGGAHILAGVSITTGILSGWAARLEALMISLFVALLHVPRVFLHPSARIEWTMLCISLLFCGAAWIIAGYLQTSDHPPV